MCYNLYISGKNWSYITFRGIYPLVSHLTVTNRTVELLSPAFVLVYRATNHPSQVHLCAGKSIESRDLSEQKTFRSVSARKRPGPESLKFRKKNITGSPINTRIRRSSERKFSFSIRKPIGDLLQPTVTGITSVNCRVSLPPLFKVFEKTVGAVVDNRSYVLGSVVVYSWGSFVVL